MEPTSLNRCNYEGCSKSFTTINNLERHIKQTHQGLGRFICSYCQKSLSSRQNLKDHTNIHTGARPYRCEWPECKAEFRQLSLYYLHKQLHIEFENQSAETSQQHRTQLNFVQKLTKEVLEEKKSTNESHCIENLTLPPVVQERQYTGLLPEFMEITSLV